MDAEGFLGAWQSTIDVDLTAHVLIVQNCLADLPVATPKAAS